MALLPEVAAQHAQPADSDESSNDNDAGTDMWKLLVDGQETDLAEQAKRINGTQYRNLNIVFGSAAEVERVWSVASFILTKGRMSIMDPILFESLMFLKYNRAFWGKALILQAYKDAQNEVKTARLEKLLKATALAQEMAGSETDDSDEE